MDLIIRRHGIQFNHLSTDTSKARTNNELIDNDMNNLPVIHYQQFPFQPKGIALPPRESNPNGFVYIIMSMRCLDQLYIGQTIDLQKRLKQHNQGYSSKSFDQERHKYRPWCIIAYICGFNNENTRRRFETECQVFQKRFAFKEPDSTVVDLMKGIADELLPIHTNPSNISQYYGEL